MPDQDPPEATTEPMQLEQASHSLGLVARFLPFGVVRYLLLRASRKRRANTPTGSEVFQHPDEASAPSAEAEPAEQMAVPVPSTAPGGSPDGPPSPPAAPSQPPGSFFGKRYESPKGVLFDSNASYCFYLAQEANRLATMGALAVSQEPHYLELQRFFLRYNIQGLIDPQELEKLPQVQQQLANITQYLPSKWLLQQELEALDLFTGDVHADARARNAIGICFSGGGIRSATFNLGILQALAAQDRLKHLDYISSVSGGGYIHGFLAQWIKEDGELARVQQKLTPIPGNVQPSASPEVVAAEPIRWLRRYSNYLAPRAGIFSLDSWTIAATWIRNAVLNGIVVLSTLLLVLMLPYGILSCMDHHGSLPPALKAAAQSAVSLSPTQQNPLVFYFFVGFTLLACSTMAWRLYLGLKGLRLKTDSGKPQYQGAPGWVILAWMLMCSLLCLAFVRPLYDGGGDDALQGYVCAGAQAITCPHTDTEWRTLGVQVLGEASRNGQTPAAKYTGPSTSLGLRVYEYFSMAWPYHPEFWHVADIPWQMYFFFLLCAIFMATIALSSSVPTLYVVLRMIGFFLLTPFLAWGLVECARLLFFCITVVTGWNYRQEAGICFLPPLLFSIPFILSDLTTGLLSRRLTDAQREWLARARAINYLLCAAWLAFGVLCFFAPRWFALIAASTAATYSVWGSWLLTSAAGLFASGSSKTSGRTQSSQGKTIALEVIAKIAPPIFVIGFLILFSRMAAWLVYANHISAGEVLPMDLAKIFLVTLAVAIFFGWRVDINDFSMHAFYRNRLARCYAAASNERRIQNLFTGFSSSDTELMVKDLLPKRYKYKDENLAEITGDYDGPFPIFCTSINLTSGEDLAYQERRAASFAFTPLFSGYGVNWTEGDDDTTQFDGFVRTRDYAWARSGGVSVATAVTTSGAAASPNMGYHTNPATAFLLTLFNVRLGIWLRNTRRRRIGLKRIEKTKSNHKLANTPTLVDPLPRSPRFGLLKMVDELFGMTNDTTSYVYLTDGGHFDNMGLYELVRRRCRTIVICDAECDGHFGFGGLGIALRKARIDFGVEITLTGAESPAVPLQKSSTRAATAFSAEVTREDPLEVTGLLSRSGVPGNGPSLSSFAAYPTRSIHSIAGTIRYPEDPAGVLGNILYIKATLSGDEPADVLAYRKDHTHFPHDSTANQFFTESQFESYRRLGEHIVMDDSATRAWLSRHMA